MTELNAEQVIGLARKKFGSGPREMDEDQQRSFKLKIDIFQQVITFITLDKMRVILRDQNILRDRGRVVWGFLVQANQAVFNPKNRETLPAALIYSPDAYFDDQIDSMTSLARGLFDLKGKSHGNREIKRFTDAITNEYTRILREPLPSSLCDGKTAYFATFFVQPSHLPAGYLADGVFPIVICPEETQAVMILPANYWPKQLRELWSNDE